MRLGVTGASKHREDTAVSYRCEGRAEEGLRRRRRVRKRKVVDDKREKLRKKGVRRC